MFIRPVTWLSKRRGRVNAGWAGPSRRLRPSDRVAGDRRRVRNFFDDPMEEA